MVNSIAEAVYQGNQVCGAFYGHPGVFAYAGHRLVRLLRSKGYDVVMEPGISAEDCLIADLGLDPSKNGVQALDVNQFLFYQHIINPHCLLIIWQVGLTGDFNFKSTNADKFNNGLSVLKDELLAYYPAEHQLILYQAATFTLENPKIEYIPLSALDKCKPTVLSTLVVPSVGMPGYDEEVMAKFGFGVKQFERNLDGILDE
jgi:uncharacterized protein YabN with tetrapyrrole methylase and pyrophosphatase domain